MKKTAIITGASRGIGRAMAEYFLNHGYDIAVSCKSNTEKLEELQDLAQSLNRRCVTFTGDMGDYETCRAFYEKATEALGNIQVLINNAGISFVGLFQDTTPELWQRLVQTNLNSVYNLCHLAVPPMVQAKCGRIINISSIWGNHGASCEVAYSATKGAINSFTKALGRELAPSGILVNAIACGAIETEMNHFLSEEEKEALTEEIPLGRFGKPEEVAALALRLAEELPYLTAQVITMDGGFIG